MQRSVIKFNRHSTSLSRHGTSLIEVLVVLVILAVGILSIVRLFPAGFIALRNAENSTFADRLAQGALEALKKNNGALPDAIYMYSDTNGYDPTVNPDPNTSDINSQRYISNETITVPASRVIGSQAYPPLYVVNYGPIYLPADVATVTPPAISIHYLPVNGTPWTARTGDAGFNPGDAGYSTSVDKPNDVLQAGQPTFLVDYGAGKIAVPQAGYDQTFVLQVTRQISGVQTPVTITVPATTTTTPPTGYDGNWFGTTDTTANGAPLPVSTATDPWTSATLYRPFEYMGTVGTSNDQAWTSDPYEFKVFSANIGTNANMGVLAFNPLASGQNGAQALKARISYMALDWHILHEDHDVSAGSSTIRLTLNHLKKVGDTQFDQTAFSGLIPGATTSADLILLDLDNGTLTPLNTSNVQNEDDNSGATAGDGIYQVSYQNGRISFPDKYSDHTMRPDQHLRIFYAGDADWAVALQKAPSVYNIVNMNASHNITTPTNADYQVLTTTGPMPNKCVIDIAAERVYFPICDSGETAEFDGISYTSGGSSRTIAVGTGAISIDTDVPNNANANTKLPYINLSNSGLNPSDIIMDTPDTTKPITFTAVRGVSARAVVIWHERNRWRVRTTDTLLTQTQ